MEISMKNSQCISFSTPYCDVVAIMFMIIIMRNSSTHLYTQTSIIIYGEWIFCYASFEESRALKIMEPEIIYKDKKILSHKRWLSTDDDKLQTPVLQNFPDLFLGYLYVIFQKLMFSTCFIHEITTRCQCTFSNMSCQ